MNDQEKRVIELETEVRILKEFLKEEKADKTLPGNWYYPYLPYPNYPYLPYPNYPYYSPLTVTVPSITTTPYWTITTSSQQVQS